MLMLSHSPSLRRHRAVDIKTPLIDSGQREIQGISLWTFHPSVEMQARVVAIYCFAHKALAGKGFGWYISEAVSYLIPSYRTANDSVFVFSCP